MDSEIHDIYETYMIGRNLMEFRCAMILT